MYFDDKRRFKARYNRKLSDFGYDSDIWEQDWVIDEHGDLVLSDDKGVRGIEL